MISHKPEKQQGRLRRSEKWRKISRKGTISRTEVSWVNQH
jgi:hypothetical protein